MEKMNFVFQTDSDDVRKVFRNHSNYLIEYSQSRHDRERYCALYFSSNSVYFPNTSEAFYNQLVKKDKFEWYRTRIQNAEKHIFLRDIKKQWYLSGINGELDSIERLLHFLKKETEGYRIITLGSSAGGFAAVLFGQLLDADRIYSFNGQFGLSDLLLTSSESINPIIFRGRSNPEINQYFNLRPFIKRPEKIYYFYSNRNKWDMVQLERIADMGMHFIPFNTSNHGIPFLKSNLPYILNLEEERLNDLSKCVYSPFSFSMKTQGLLATFSGILKQVMAYLSNVIKH